MHILPISEQINCKTDFKKSYGKKAVKMPDGQQTVSILPVLTMIFACGLFVTSRGFQKNTDKYLSKFKYFLEKRLEKNSGAKSDKWVNFYRHSINGINSFIKKSESVNNITSLKDVLFMKLMYKSKPTQKIHKSISDYFEKLSYKTVLNSYEKTGKNFQKMNEAFDELDKLILKNSENEKIEYNGKVYTKRELTDIARNCRTTVNILVKTFLSKSSLESRYKYINDVTHNLYSDFWNASFKDFWSKDNKFKRKEMWQTFIAAEQIEGDKTNLADLISATRITLIYKNTDKTRLLRKYIKKLIDIIPTDDKNNADIVKKLVFYSKHPEALKDNKAEFLDELTKLENYQINLTYKNIEEAQNNSKNTCISIVKALAHDKTRGELQDMLSIYNKIAPLELDKTGAFYTVEKAVKSFDKSVNYESVEFFDKIRDLRLGSAPTDVLTICFSSAALAFGLGYANDKDKRVSVMLKSGIPVLGGIATTVISTTKLISGGKSLAFGFIAGLILNKFGNIADRIYKQNQSADK